ncbi:MAG: hypothetical protein ACFFDN_05785 [Candidatus Hodarchaeota archaeon]
MSWACKRWPLTRVFWGLRSGGGWGWGFSGGGRCCGGCVCFSRWWLVIRVSGFYVSG